ncbi:MAG TPA: hypothetical protein VNC50_18300 [Planctomycetia bacterium]|nr:hypothetical protein [Planctomycetia bacterium]
MDEMNFSKAGTRVFWGAFALLLIGAALATMPGAPVPGQPRWSVPVFGFMLPWKWVFTGLFFVALMVAFVIASVFDHFLLRRRQERQRSETFQLAE